ncbi:hypothetical protein ACH4OW_19055 [Streptomyces sp. NPDC017056]|uniref:hypothetical protein n=1 Tax=Streptomyces sp. NPDC017056 TaxID=3364973 RepID=UPI0037A005C0
MSVRQPHRTLPADLLASAEWRDACRRRDFPHIFRLVKVKAGIYPAQIATLCDMTPSRVGEVAAGRRGLAHIDVIERVSDGLRIPGAMLGLAHRPWEIPSVPSSDAPPSSCTSTAAPDTWVTWEATPEGAEYVDDLFALADGHITASSLVALRSSAEDYWHRDDQHGAAALRPAVVGHLRYVTQLGHGCTQEFRGELRSLAAELARMAGWAYFDACRYSTARAYLAQALKLSLDQADRLFVANVLQTMSLQAMYDSNPMNALALACQAQDTARAAVDQPLVMSMLYLREAFAQAMLSDSPACHAAIDEAHRQYDRARGREQEAPFWARYFDEAKLIVDTGIALARLGEAPRAEPLIAEGLRRENGSRQRGRAFHAFWLASTQLQQGALDRACDSAGVALDLLAVVDSPRVKAHIRDFHQRLTPYARATPVIAFEQRMREVFC